MKTDKKRSITIWDILPWIWLGAGVLLMLIYHIGPGKALVDGDMAGEMILSDLLNKEGDFLLSDNWYQATEIHVFFMQIIFRPLLLIWPNNWHIARVVGMVIIYTVNLAGYLFMMKQTGIKRLAVWSAGTLMWPVGMWRLFLGLYGGQYLVYDFFAFYIIGLILYLTNSYSNNEGGTSKFKPAKLIPALILGFLSFAGGVNGIRETMMLFMPICLGITILVITHLFRHKNTSSWKKIISDERKTVILLLWIIYATVCNLAGYAYNLLVLMKKYSFQKNTDMIWVSDFSLGSIIDSISQFFGLFGYSGDKKLLSALGICSATGVVIAAVLIFIVTRLFVNRSKLDLAGEFLLVTFVSGLIGCSVIFGMLKDMNEPRFYLPFMFFAIVLFELEWDVEEIKIPNLKRVIALLVSLCIVIASIGSVAGEIKNPHVGKAKNAKIAKYLCENGYTQGYAQFWLANPITEFTSGAVAARPLMYADSFEMMGWSNRIDYTTSYPEGKVFLLIDKKSYPGDVYEGYAFKYGSFEKVLDDENWLLLVFDKAEDIEKAYRTALSNGDAITQAQRIAED